MNISREIPEKFRDQVKKMGEWRYGSQRVTVILKDGTEIKDVYVAYAREIVKVGNGEVVPFDITEISKVKKQW